VLLLTGFEPFGGLARNPSGDIARLLGTEPGIESAVLPVDYRRIEASLGVLLEREWRAVVLLGVAVGRSQISLERVAINYRDPTRPDNAGYRPETQEIVVGGPDAHFSSLPLERLRDALREEGIAVEISLSAGPYLCNAAMYLARQMLAADIPCGFVHLPATPDLACGATPMEFETQVQAVRCLLRALR
jgi:pyroglutamyl-peptidase